MTTCYFGAKVAVTIFLFVLLMIGLWMANAQDEKVSNKPFLRINIAGFGFFVLLLLNAPSLTAFPRVESVHYVIDGDTVILTSGERIRLIGINAPEISHNGLKGQVGGIEAKKYLKHLLLNQVVNVVYGVESNDHFGRSLAYLIRSDGMNVSIEMVKKGYATVSLHPPNLRHAAKLLLAQSDAERHQQGIWSIPTYRAKPVSQAYRTNVNAWGRYTAKVIRITRVKQGIKLWLKKDIYIWIDQTALANFPPIDSYLGKTIEMRGWVRKRGLFWSINALHRSQIVLKRAH